MQTIGDQMIPLGALVRDDGSLRVPAIRDFELRKRWQEKNAMASVLAFYNSGKNLFIDPIRNPATTFYHYPWEWMRYEDFHTPRYIKVCDKKFINGTAEHLISIVHKGHHSGDRSATILMGLSGWIHKSGKRLFDKRFTIPNRCILFVAVHYFHIRDYLLVYNPLPLKYVMTAGANILHYLPTPVTDMLAETPIRPVK